MAYLNIIYYEFQTPRIKVIWGVWFPGGYKKTGSEKAENRNRKKNRKKNRKIEIGKRTGKRKTIME